MAKWETSSHRGYEDNLFRFMVAKKYEGWYLNGFEMPELGTREGRLTMGHGLVRDCQRWGKEAGT